MCQQSYNNLSNNVLQISSHEGVSIKLRNMRAHRLFGSTNDKKTRSGLFKVHLCNLNSKLKFNTNEKQKQKQKHPNDLKMLFLLYIFTFNFAKLASKCQVLSLTHFWTTLGHFCTIRPSDLLPFSE